MSTGCHRQGHRLNGLTFHLGARWFFHPAGKLIQPVEPLGFANPSNAICMIAT